MSKMAYLAIIWVVMVAQLQGAPIPPDECYKQEPDRGYASMFQFIADLFNAIFNPKEREIDYIKCPQYKEGYGFESSSTISTNIKNYYPPSWVTGPLNLITPRPDINPVQI